MTQLTALDDALGETLGLARAAGEGDGELAGAARLEGDDAGAGLQVALPGGGRFTNGHGGLR